MSQTEPRASQVRVAHLTGATIADAPQCCVGCTWWQQRVGGRPPDKRRWMEEVQEQFGPWGKLYLDGGRADRASCSTARRRRSSGRATCRPGRRRPTRC